VKLAPFLYHVLPGDRYVCRPIAITTTHDIADIAIGYPYPMTHNETGQSLATKFLALANRPCDVGTPIATYAYPKTVVTESERRTVRFEPSYFTGRVVEHYPQGRDRFLLPGISYRTTMFLHGGSSGGPVFGTNGSVFAINSTAIDDQDVSFVTCISQALGLRIPNASLPGEDAPRDTTVYELGRNGIVIFDDG